MTSAQASTRITVVLDVDHKPDIDLPYLAARYLEEALGKLEGCSAVEVVRGETGNVEWEPSA